MDLFLSIMSALAGLVIDAVTDVAVVGQPFTGLAVLAALLFAVIASRAVVPDRDR